MPGGTDEVEHRRGRRAPVRGPRGVALALLVLGACAACGGGPPPRTGPPSPASTVRHVAPGGDDTNPGTAARPWRTFAGAAQAARPGDEVVFADGHYLEVRPARFARGGTDGRRIVFRAAHRHAAHLGYAAGANLDRILVEVPYVSIRDFDITAGGWGEGATTADILVAFRKGGDHGEATGNRIHHVYEEALKASHVTGFLARDNELSDTAHEGLDVVDAVNSTLQRNVVHDVGRIGIVVKGGSRNVRTVDNLVTRANATAETGFTAYSIGGVTGANSTYDTSGYEGYRLVAQNNIAAGQQPGAIRYGFSVAGCDRCAIVNNTVVGARYGLLLRNGGDALGSYGQAPWTALTRDPVVQNNIVTDCDGGALDRQGTLQGSLLVDHNLFFRCPGAPRQAHGLDADPRFVDPASDWRLQPNSPAARSGTALPDFPPYRDARTPETPATDLGHDRDGRARTSPWGLGAYRGS